MAPICKKIAGNRRPPFAFFLRRASKGVAAWLALAAASVSGTGAIAQLAPDIPVMTINIYNNSTDENIFPLISFPGQGSSAKGQPGDKWMQGFFQVPQGQLDSQKYGSQLTINSGGNAVNAVTRMYINCCEANETGIPPGGSVSITLPLYSPLVNPIDPTAANQLIEWWQGGNINFYYVPSNSPNPQPAALLAHWNETTQQTPNPIGAPQCAAPASCHIRLAIGNPLPSEPQQLIEYTLGAAPNNPNGGQTGQPFYLFDANNVDYDVSYVNTAYLPAVMEPFGNALMGWVGTPDTIDGFTSAVTNFLAGKLKNGDSIILGQGWPLLNDPNGAPVPGKIPSALEIFAEDVVSGGPNDGQWLSPSHFTPSPANSPPIMAMIQSWQTCQANPKATDPYCTRVNDVTALLLANYQNYRVNYDKNSAWNCDKTQTPHPNTPQPTYLQLLQHLYGWQNFNEHCAPDANLLWQTPGYDTQTRQPRGQPNGQKTYESVKTEFDNLQYWVNVLNGQYGVFHPYVSLMHGPDYVNAPYVYAYSVDDAVGNVQTDGAGLIIAVGGLQNLPNPDHATPDVNFNFGVQSDYPSGKISFTDYGRCTPTPDTPVNPNFASFPVPIGVTKPIGNCLVTFVDNLGLGRHYQFKVNPPNPTWPTDPNYNPAGQSYVVGCADNTDPQVRGWCNGIWVYQQTLNDARSTVKYNVQIGAPPPPSTLGGARR